MATPPTHSESRQLALIAIEQTLACLRSGDITGAESWLDAAQTYVDAMDDRPVARQCQIILAVGEWPEWLIGRAEA